MQETCLRLMGKKMLVALMMEGKLSDERLRPLDADEDLMSAMARELVEEAGGRGKCRSNVAQVRTRAGMGAAGVASGSDRGRLESGSTVIPKREAFSTSGALNRLRRSH
jgi:8-oxo-dGTP pyrophosphatase MutT (NUDIX family)